MTAWTVTRLPARSRPARARRRRPVRRLAHQHDRNVVPDGIGLAARGANDPGLLEEEVALARGADQNGLEVVVDHRRASRTACAARRLPVERLAKPLDRLAKPLVHVHPRLPAEE